MGLERRKRAISLAREPRDILIFFFLSFVMRFACNIGQSAKFGFEFYLRSSPSASSGYGWSVDQLITSLLATPCWRDPTRSKQLSTVAILGFQFGLYYVVVPLSFLRSISLASLFTSLSIFGWSDLLQILRKLAAFSFPVLDIIVSRLLNIIRMPCGQPVFLILKSRKS